MKIVDDPKSKLQSIEFGDDALKSADNKRNRRAEIQISENGDATIKSTLTLTGLYATEGKGFWVNAMKEDSLSFRLQRSLKNRFKDKDVTVNTVAVKKHEIVAPFDFQIEYNVTVKGLFEIKDGQMSIKGSDWLGHSTRWINNAKKRSLDYHNAFSGVDIEEFILVFPYAVTLENAADLGKSTDNEFASYKMTVQQIKDNTIRLQSRYAVKQLLVPAAKATVQQTVNESLEKVSDSRWNFKKK
jgi:hypothetical protein